MILVLPAMRLFIISITVFLGIIIIPFLILVSYVLYANSRLADNYRIGSKISSIVIGDSHTQKAINEIYWPEAINLSQSSECFPYTYIKLKTLFKNNPTIKTVFLGCGYNSFSSYYNEFIFGKYSAEVSSRYFFIMPFSMKMQYLDYNRIQLGQYIRKIIENGISNLHVAPSGYSFLGCYETYSTNVKLTNRTIKKRTDTHYYTNNVPDDFSDLNILYFHKIIDLCLKHKIRIIILDTPMHKFYTDQVPVKFKKKFDYVMTSSKLQVINFKNLRLPDSCFLPDGDHVTNDGARLSTLFLVDYLKMQKQL
jgi:hypothetical protein